MLILGIPTCPSKREENAAKTAKVKILHILNNKFYAITTHKINKYMHLSQELLFVYHIMHQSLCFYFIFIFKNIFVSSIRRA